MLFFFSEIQWASIGKHIIKLGGEPTDWVRSELQGDIDRIFARERFYDQKVALLRRLSAAAYELNDALEQLANIGREEAKRDEFLRDQIIEFDVNDRVRFAKQVRQFAEGADYALEKGFSAYSEKPRGRPSDTKLLAWAAAVLRVALREGWTIEDERARILAAFLDLMLELAGAAREVGLDHTRDIRRSITRAVAIARSENEAEEQNRGRVNRALNAIVPPEQKTTAANSNCLCSVPAKSD